MASLIINRLDYLRLKERALQAKFGNGELAAQANSLLKGVHRATLVEPSEMPPDVITMNSVVRIMYLDSKKTMELRLVYPEQADLKQNRISVLAPMASALLGCKKGDTVQLKLPHGVVQIKIDRLIYQPEAEGHFFL